MLFDFTNRVAVVTGSGSTKGFGRATALMLAGQGCDIVSADINAAGVEETARMARELGRKAIGVAVDISDPESVKNLMKKTVDTFGKIDILLNIAGISQAIGTIDCTLEDWNRMIAINLSGAFHCIHEALPYMKEKGYGRIVNVSSIAAMNGGGVFAGSNYIAAKAGIIGLTKSVGKEMAPFGISTNCVAPGPSNTDLVDTDFTPMAKNIPAGRIAKPNDIAAALTFLASEEAGYITGVTINVNGGLYIG